MWRRLLGALVLLVQLSAAQTRGDALGEAPGDSPGVRIVKDMLIEKALALARLKAKHTKQGHTEYVAALKQLQHDQAVLRERLLRYAALKHNEKNRSFSVGVPPVPSWQHFAAACAMCLLTGVLTGIFVSIADREHKALTAGIAAGLLCYLTAMSVAPTFRPDRRVCPVLASSPSSLSPV
jgi:hypothetical protein